jgi:hypothetical protein
LARNLKKVAPQKQNAIRKTRAQYAKRNCAFELFKAHCAATIYAKSTSFQQKIIKRKERNAIFSNDGRSSMVVTAVAQWL